MNILCGTDFSPNATEAVTTAAALARRFRDTLTLVHASVPPADDGITPEVWLPVETALRRQLESQAAQVRSGALSVETLLELGTPVAALERLAAPGRSRMIVLSSIGRVALARVLLGSTADRVAESAPIPTLVVRRGTAFLDWTEGRRPLKIFVAADFSEASDAAIAFAGDWSRTGQVELIIGHVAHPDDGRDRRTAGAVIERDLQERATLVLGKTPFTLEVELSSQDASAILIELAKEHGADLLVTGTHQVQGVKRLWHRSISRALLADAPMNVAVVPAMDSGASGPIPPLQRVLVATDLSRLGNRAIPAACALLPQGGIVRVLHVVPATGRGSVPAAGKPRRDVLSPGEQEARIRNLRRTLTRLVPPETVARGIAVETRVVTADPVAETILGEALDFGAHVVCLGSNGRNAALEALLGSVARRVIERSHVPVHLVLPNRD